MPATLAAPHGVTRRLLHRLAAVVMAAIVATIGLAPPALADAPAIGELVLPAPTGPHPVGRDVMHLVDPDRADPWVPAERRELMVSVWYPAAVARGSRVPYASAEESRLMLEFVGLTEVPPDALTRVRTHARDGAPLMQTGHRLPLVVLSPGFTDPRWMQTTLAEDLASRGYVVVGIDHPHEGAVVTLPGGRVVQCVECDKTLPAAQATASRARDMGFVLDRMLTDRRWGRVVDARRVAAIGHSRGGAASLVLMENDPRVVAGLNMDGSVVPPPGQDVRRPFLLLGGGAHPRPSPTDPTWDPTWARLTGWARWLYVPDMSHRSFSDAAVLGKWLGVDTQAPSGERTVEITRAYVAAFLDMHLRHRSEPLMQGPSAGFPEVQFAGVTG
ncbi:alpha/beta hydrolase family protein [Actinoplanes sp. NPDC049265]|uniref:alpha/beta hydrolase family protein n=1 Tax=Actinoplanes sp. NPDC049265 TaxID=3363902 RepID=UPI003724B885